MDDKIFSFLGRHLNLLISVQNFYAVQIFFLEIPCIIFFIYFEKAVTMLMNIYIMILWILFQLFTEINCQMVPFKPEERSAHTATLINNKLYILGGTSAGKEFFYLDVSVPFNTQNLLWQNLTSVNIIPP